MPNTLVSFHAHPDDETLLTGGTLARAAAQGHRVVVVFATDGGAGLTADAVSRPAGLAGVRRAEAARAAALLGAARVVHLGYADSGDAGTGSPSAGTFAAADVEVAAEQLAAVLGEERAAVLTSYDAQGGYGHPDHVMVHRVGARAAALARTSLLLEATADRTTMSRLAAVLRRLPAIPADLAKNPMTGAYTAREDLTHRIDVTAVLGAKRAAMAAHASQRTGGSGRTLDVLLRLPGPVFTRAMRHEWFVQPGIPPQSPLLPDVFLTLPVAA